MELKRICGSCGKDDVRTLFYELRIFHGSATELELGRGVACRHCLGVAVSDLCDVGNIVEVRDFEHDDN